MNERPYETAHVDELDALPVDDEGLTWRPIRRRFDIRAFGVNAYTAAGAGSRVVEEHSEPENHEELYVVLRGAATFTVDGDEVDAPAGTLLFVRPGTRRGAVARADGTAVLVIGAKRGEVFEPSAWETVFAANGYAKLGDLERARALMSEAVAGQPEAWQGHYNLACLEAVAGNTEDALAHLNRAFELDADEVRRYAAADDDLAQLRSDPRFPPPA